MRCIEPGTGCKGAAGASSMKLARVTRSPECNAVPTRLDPELEVKYESSGTYGAGVSLFVFILFMRVRDLEIEGRKEHVDRSIGHVESVCGKWEGDFDDFTNCGVHQHRSAVTLDQGEQIAGHVDLSQSKADEAP
eukprot:520263-Pyramimonas_sp.AAC.1